MLARNHLNVPAKNHQRNKLKGGNPYNAATAAALIQPKLKGLVRLGDVMTVINEPEVKNAINDNNCAHGELVTNLKRLMRIVDEGDIGELQYLGDSKANIIANLEKSTPIKPTKAYILNLGGIRTKVVEIIKNANIK